MTALPADLLRRSPMFAGMAASEVALVAKHFQAARFAKGESIYLKCDPGDCLYFIESGQIRLSIVTVEGRELSVRLAQAGEIIGEIAVLDDLPRSANATALTAVSAWSLSRHHLDQLLTDDPRLARALIVFLCRRLRDTTDQMESIALYPIEVRLARFLLISLGNRQGTSVVYKFPVSQGELAQLLGASRPKLNVALGSLESSGGFSRQGDQMICNVAVLGQIANGIHA